jgi:hypothetical protein
MPEKPESFWILGMKKLQNSAVGTPVFIRLDWIF